MSGAAADFEQDGKGGALRFSGDLSLARLGTLPQRLEKVDGKVASMFVRAMRPAARACCGPTCCH